MIKLLVLSLNQLYHSLSSRRRSVTRGLFNSSFVPCPALYLHYLLLQGDIACQDYGLASRRFLLTCISTGYILRMFVMSSLFVMCLDFLGGHYHEQVMDLNFTDVQHKNASCKNLGTALKYFRYPHLWLCARSRHRIDAAT